MGADSAVVVRGSATLAQPVAALFPPGVVAVELRGLPTESLHPDEAAACRHAVPKRIAEFTAGRLCARRALAELGRPAIALGVLPDGQADWPAGVIGSISHTADFCCAVVARNDVALSVGVDAERIGSVEAELWPLLFGADEIHFLEGLPSAERPAAATLMFSAKEAFYKCQFAVTREWLDFADVTLSLDAHAGSFTVLPTRPLWTKPFRAPLLGRFLEADGLIVSGIAMRD